MKIEEIRSVQVDLPFCQVRMGRALTVIEMLNNGKQTGRDLVFKTETEIKELIEALTVASTKMKESSLPERTDVEVAKLLAEGRIGGF